MLAVVVVMKDTPPKNYLIFLAYYLEDEAKRDYLQEAKYKIEYPSFDWSLNDLKKGAV